MSTKSRQIKQYNRMMKKFINEGKASVITAEDMINFKFVPTRINPKGFTFLDPYSEEFKNHPEYKNWNNNNEELKT
jgi:hypothetical protein